MYLNIINNLTYESKRKNKKFDKSISSESEIEENNNMSQISKNDDNAYYSIFYGDLTRTWIKLNSKKI